MPGPDLADLIAYAQARDGKVILAGDTGQLQAVENGGGMSLLAAALGYVRLAEPVRFRSEWEQHASLRLHDGDTTVLADYDQHGRILGGEPEQMMDEAAAAYVALAADGTDVLLMAADHALRRELCRRIRDDLIALGVVAAAPAVRIADGAQASAGDLITCTRMLSSVMSACHTERSDAFPSITCAEYPGDSFFTHERVDLAVLGVAGPDDDEVGHAPRPIHRLAPFSTQPPPSGRAEVSGL